MNRSLIQVRGCTQFWGNSGEVTAHKASVTLIGSWFMLIYEQERRQKACKLHRNYLQYMLKNYGNLIGKIWSKLGKCRWVFGNGSSKRTQIRQKKPRWNENRLGNIYYKNILSKIAIIIIISKFHLPFLSLRFRLSSGTRSSFISSFNSREFQSRRILIR